MSTNTSIVCVVAIVSLCLLMAYIVHATGSAAGLADLGRAVAEMTRAAADVIRALVGPRR